jgi:hypothetical protein
VKLVGHDGEVVLTPWRGGMTLAGVDAILVPYLVGAEVRRGRRQS